MEVLKPKLIEERNAVSMDEAIDYIPGVNIIDGQANIRGGSGWSYGAGSRVQILVDDLPQLTADANDAKWNFIPVENLEQVEVIKGASSVLFGSSALNGVINIRTAYPRDTALTKINCFGGVYDKAYITTDKRYSLNFRDNLSGYGGINFFHSRKIKNLDLVVGGNYFKDNGYRQGENENRGRINFNTRYNFKTPGLSAGINFNSMINSASIFFLWKNDTSGAYIPAENTLSEIKTSRINIDPFITYVSRGGSIHKLRGRWFNSTNTNNTNQNSTSNLYYSEYQYQKHFNQFTLTGGLVEIISEVNSELYNNHTGYQDAAYIQGDFRWNRLTISGGARVEQNKVDNESDKITPVFRSGLNYHLGKATYVRASIGQGYRYPSIAEKFISTSVGGAIIFPNENLKSEKGLSIEAGVKQVFQFGRFEGYFDAAVFENDYYNMIEFVFASWEHNSNPYTDNGFKSVNVGDTRIKGFELGFALKTKITQNADLIIQGGYTYLDPRQLTYDSAYVAEIGPGNVMGSDSTDFLKYRYRHMLRGDIELDWKKISIGTSVRYNSRMENIDKIFTGGWLDFLFYPGLGIDDYRKYFTNGDIVFDFRSSYEFNKNFQLSFIVKNVFNYIYMQRPADMQPPRTFVLQASFKF
jgi:outer membrane receptor protein involved in Fe transport